MATEAPPSQPASLGWAALGLALAVVLVGSCYAIAVPLGEAPDEPAHIAYVRYVLAHGALPPLPTPPYGDRYESYQAPLDYLATAGLAKALGSHLRVEWVPNPAFSFARQGSRAYLPISGGGPSAASLRLLRIARLLWTAATAVLVLATTSHLARGRLDLALAATVPFVLSPQFLFVGATINNDGALVTLAAFALLGLVKLLDSPSPLTALLTGIAVGLAPWCKVSGSVLAVPLGLTALVLVKRRCRRAVLLLVGAAATLTALSIGLAEARFGSPLPPSPVFLAAPAAAIRLLDPHWLGSLVLSFWGKLGWLNLKLPLLSYAFFALPTALVAAGIFCRSRQTKNPAYLRALLASVVVTNLLLVIVFLVRVDWQPQGRYLFPSIPALAALSVLALGAVDERCRPRFTRIAVVFLVVSAAGMAILGVVAIDRAYS